MYLDHEPNANMIMKTTGAFEPFLKLFLAAHNSSGTEITGNSTFSLLLQICLKIHLRALILEFSGHVLVAQLLFLLQGLWYFLENASHRNLVGNFVKIANELCMVESRALQIRIFGYRTRCHLQEFLF